MPRGHSTRAPHRFVKIELRDGRAVVTGWGNGVITETNVGLARFEFVVKRTLDAPQQTHYYVGRTDSTTGGDAPDRRSTVLANVKAERLVDDNTAAVDFFVGVYPPVFDVAQPAHWISAVHAFGVEYFGDPPAKEPVASSADCGELHADGWTSPDGEFHPFERPAALGAVRPNPGRVVEVFWAPNEARVPASLSVVHERAARSAYRQARQAYQDVRNGTSTAAGQAAAQRRLRDQLNRALDADGNYVPALLMAAEVVAAADPVRAENLLLLALDADNIYGWERWYADALYKAALTRLAEIEETRKHSDDAQKLATLAAGRDATTYSSIVELADLIDKRGIERPQDRLEGRDPAAAGSLPLPMDPKTHEGPAE